MNLKPNIHFCRKPRSIFEVGHFKASELMDMLLYYLRYCLVGILPTKVVKHFEKLSAATYILLQKEIKKYEVRVASELFIEFAKEYEEIYGQGAVTMNLHLLNHYHRMIFQCGPLWSYNMFGFENNIGNLKKLVCGTRDVLNQIATKYVISLNEQTTDNYKHAVQKHPLYLYQQSTIILKKEYEYLFGNSECNEMSLQIWKRIRKNGIVYSSTSAVATKAIDYFVKMADNQLEKFNFSLVINVNRNSCCMYLK